MFHSIFTFHSVVQGMVCDNFWDLVDANVTCRQLGYPLGARQATYNSVFGSASYLSQAYLMTNTRCSGNETSLLDCPHSTASSYCGQRDAAGVVCNGEIALQVASH